MWQYSLQVGQERIRRSEAEARSDRFVREAAELRRSRPGVVPGPIRLALAGLLRKLSTAAAQLAATACRAATLVDGRTA